MYGRFIYFLKKLQPFSPLFVSFHFMLFVLLQLCLFLRLLNFHFIDRFSAFPFVLFCFLLRLQKKQSIKQRTLSHCNNGYKIKSGFPLVPHLIVCVSLFGIFFLLLLSWLKFWNFRCVVYWFGVFVCQVCPISVYCTKDL